ncbi:MAG: hypothetical protein AAFQ82_03040 [Myxococcota bacterium]
MGLKERRAVKDYQDNQYPAQQKQIEEAAGFAVEVAVNWDTIATDGMSHLYAEAWPDVYFKPLIDALASISADDMGKEALQESLKKIEITNSDSVSSAHKWAAFEGGVLKLDHKPTTNINDVTARTQSLTTLLENSL